MPLGSSVPTECHLFFRQGFSFLSTRTARPFTLELDTWSFSGAWCLALGALPFSRSPHFSLVPRPPISHCVIHGRSSDFGCPDEAGRRVGDDVAALALFRIHRPAQGQGTP